MSEERRNKRKFRPDDDSELQLLKDYLEKDQPPEKILKALRRLQRFSVTVDLLQETKIGKVVNKFRKHEGEIGTLAKHLVDKWKQSVAESMTLQMSQSDTGSIEKTESSTTPTQTKIIESDLSAEIGAMAVESIDNVIDTEKSSNHDDSRHKSSETSMKQHSSSSHYSEINSREISHNGKSSPRNLEFVDYADKDFPENKSCSRDSEKSHRSREALEKDYKKSKSHYSDHRCSKKSHNDDDGKLDKSSGRSHREKSSDSSLQKNSCERSDREKTTDKSTRGKSSEKSHREKSSEKSSEISHREKSNEKSHREKSSEKSHREKSSEKSGEKSSDKSHHHHKSSEKSHHDHSSSHKSRSDSGKHRDKDRKHSSTSSRHSNLNVEKIEETKDAKHDIDVIEDNSKTVSVKPVKAAIREADFLSVQSSSNVTSDSDYPSGENGVKRKKRSIERKSTLPTFDLPSPQKLGLQEADILASLPQTVTNYKPLPHVVRDSSRFRVSDEEIGTKKHSRTTLYSGKRNRTLAEVPKLYDACMQILMDNIDSLECVGGIPYFILKPLLEKCTPVQLFTLEDYNPHLIEDTGELWESNCKIHFRGKKREEFESWREMYLRLHDEREAKLKKLTANISAQHASMKDAGRKTKMAFVESVAKPPRDVLRRQRLHGTGVSQNKPFDPLDKLSSRGGQTSKPGSSVMKNVVTNDIISPPRIPRPSTKKPSTAPMMANAMRMMKKLRR